MKKKVLALLLIGLLALSLTVFAACETTARRNPKDSTDSGSTSEHEHDYDTIVVPPTCEEKGFTTYVCKICGFAYAGDYVDATGHDWNDGEVTIAATCEAAGEMTYTCTVCGKTKTEEIPQLIHSYSEEWSSDDESHWHACIDEGFEELKQGEGAHTWNDGDITTAATFEAAGETTYTCTVCGKTKTEEIPQLVHTYSEDWSSDDESHWHACTDEGFENLKESEGAHTWNDGEITTVATCDAKGVKTYTCAGCGKTRSEVVSAPGHDYKFDSFVWDGFTAKVKYICANDGDHVTYFNVNVTERVTTAPTCTETGIMTYTASFSGFTDSKTEVIAALGHDKVNHEAKAATCTEKGWNAYETCTRCEYSTYKEIAALGHDNVNHEAREATCRRIGWNSYETCTRCDYSSYVEIPALGHKGVNHEAKEPTCTEIGWKAYKTCTRCDYTTYEEIAALGHDIVEHEAQAATYTTVGWNAYETCTRCDYSTYAEIEVNHDYVFDSFVWTDYTAKAKYVCSHDGNHVDLRTATVTSEVTTAPTCTATGVKTYTATYDGHTDTKTETLSATGHNYVYNSFVWTGYTAKAKYICSNDSNHVDLRTATVPSEVTTPATCTATGVRTYTATYDGHSATKTETISATGHNYVYNSFVWTGYTAKAKYVCSHDSKHVELHDATVTSEVTTQPTCEGTGVRTYTATYDGHSATKTETIAATGHNYVFDSFVWTGYTAKAKYICSNDSNHVDLRTATVTSKVTTAPTCTATGVKTYTASYDGHSGTKTETIAAIGHNYVYNSFVWDGYTAKAKYVCSHDSQHVMQYDATVTNQVTTQPTCTATGVRTYTATYDGHSATKTETIAATGHAYVFDSFVWTGYTAKAKYICSNDSQHVDLRTATVTNQVTTQPTCTATGVRTYTATYDGHSATKTENIEAKGGYILFGEYPQTIKADSVTITSTTDSRGYYLGSDGAYYAKLTTDLYANGYTFTTGATIQSGTVYYFKVEPIKWRILEDYGGTATILCELIIDAHAYQSDYSIYDYFTTANGAPSGTYANNYEYSEIRKWLNENFYNTAFSELEKSIINTVLVDNSASSTMADGSTWNKGENEYACADTYDKVWLMSEEEVTKSWKYVNYASYRASDTQRRKKTTDYARANNAYTEIQEANYYGNGYWWLRSPNHRDPFSSRCIVYDGYAYDRVVEVFISRVGVVPALKISLDESTPIVHDIVNHEARAATCTRIGWNAYETCTHCDYTTYEEIPVLGHKGVNHEAKEPTCTEIGWKAYKTCTRCDYSTYEEIPALGHNYSGGVCTRCGEADPNYNSGNRAYVRVDEDGNESATGGYILFGEYPQTVKADSVTITSTTDSRGYYLGSDGVYYAKVTAKPYNSGYKFTTGATIQSGTVYYFKVEPIKWRILEDDDGTATILCEMIIDAHRFDDSSKNYNVSEIRAWLNENFYQTAFSELEKEIINTIQVDNSARSTMPYGVTWNRGVNWYSCVDTYDKVWLMSEEEITKNWKYVNYASYDSTDKQRRKLTTDYARANRVYTEIQEANYYDNGYWWLRSPYYLYESPVCWSVDTYGHAFDRYYLSEVGSFDYGVVPALQITLGETIIHVHKYVNGICAKCGKVDSNYNASEKKYVRLDENGNESTTGGYILFGEYPQTIKADSVTITDMTDYRGYYLGSDGAYYAKVTANPYNSSYTYTTGATIQSGTDYYFKVEPIKWRILELGDGTATILCEMIIDVCAYQSVCISSDDIHMRPFVKYYTFANGAEEAYANNYEYSEVRAWINESFYWIAFNGLEKGIINTVRVDNSGKSAMPWNDGGDKYACANTNDKIWLMSMEGLTRSWKYVNYTSPDSPDTQWCKQTTDYAKAIGANGCWWLRSPYYDGNEVDDEARRTRTVNYRGSTSSSDVNSPYGGVVPALQIAFLHIHEYTETLVEPTCTGKGCTIYTCDECCYEYYDNYVDTLGHNYVDGRCTRCGAHNPDYNAGGRAYVRIDQDGNESATGGYILFGEYPQTIKADSVKIIDVTDSRGYYLGSDGAFYAKVTTNPDIRGGYTFTTGATIQSGTVYYFKVEPIKWRILEDDDGTATILCEMIIDSHRFDDSVINEHSFYWFENGTNNYKESEIRAWLNNNFYRTAFSELEKGIINTVQVDNGAKSTMPYGVTWNNGVNNYACADTYDKVWLMSEEEITKSWKYVNYASYSTLDTQRRKPTTDYAKANYTRALTAVTTYYGNGEWWLRSPHYGGSYVSWCVSDDGFATYSDGVEDSIYGVVPALQITL